MPERPSGWFAACASRDLRAGEVQSRRWFGESIALYRTASGQPRAVFATCPHLGANLGAGFVQGEELVCPFHHFAFGADGRCTRTPYDSPVPKQARARTLEVRERNGLVLLWWDDAGRGPSFEVPELDLDGWNLPRLTVFRFRGHPQDTTENSVDLGHFTTVHGFDAVDLEDFEVDGPRLRVRYRFVHRLGPLAWPVSFTAHIHGLGYSLVEVHMPTLGTDVRLYVLPIPVTDGEIELRLGAAGFATGPLGRVQRRVTAAVASWMLNRDAGQDIPIWQERVYVDRPALAGGDGPIGRYRRWARQFYAEAAAAAEVA